MFKERKRVNAVHFIVSPVYCFQQKLLAPSSVFILCAICYTIFHSFT